MPSRSPIQGNSIHLKLMTAREKERHWQELAACADEEVDPEIFFPVSQWGPSDWTAPKSVCGDCPVKLECLEYAVKSHEPYGMWGGATPLQRSAMIKQRDSRRLPAVKNSDNNRRKG